MRYNLVVVTLAGIRTLNTKTCIIRNLEKVMWYIPVTVTCFIPFSNVILLERQK